MNAFKPDIIKEAAILFKVNPDTCEVKRDVEEEGISGIKHKIDLLLVPKEKVGKIALLTLGDKDFSMEVMVFNSKTEDLNISSKGIFVERDLDEKERKLLEVYNIKTVDTRGQTSYSAKGSSIFGVEAIDSRVGNLIKKGNIYMISGKTGVGKTTICLNFLVNGAKKGEKGAIILTETHPTEFISNSSSFSFGFESFYKGRMIEILKFSDQIREMKYEILSNKKEEKKFITKITTEIRKFVVGNNISRLVIDPITPALIGKDDFINVMFSGLAMPGVITMITSNVNASDVSFFGIEEYYCSGILKLELDNPNYDTKTMSIIKMRGGSYNSAPFNYRITNEGIVPEEEDLTSSFSAGNSLFRRFRM